MPVHEQPAYCGRCRCHVRARCEVPNYLRHALITLVFCPWLVVWMAAAVNGRSPLRCTRCGSTQLFE